MKLLALSLAFTSLAFAADKPVLRAGAAAVDITPTHFPMNMPGGFSSNMAEKAHDPFHSRALVLNDGTLRGTGLACECRDREPLKVSAKCRASVANVAGRSSWPASTERP